MKKGIYKFHIDCDSVIVEGIFIDTAERVDVLIKSNIYVDLRTICNDSDYHRVKLSKANIHLINDDKDGVKACYDYKLRSGYNPFDFIGTTENEYYNRQPVSYIVDEIIRKSKMNLNDAIAQVRDKDTVIYIASPYSHEDKNVIEQNFVKVSQLASEVCANGLVAISPITYGHTLLDFKEMPSDWLFWKNFCLSILNKCDKLWVYKIPGWENSNGVAEEIKVATELGMDIIYINHE